jgi:hypothetical protein
LLNEPIPGQGVFWSSATKKPYPVGVRVLSFEKKYSMLDHDYNKPAGRTYAVGIKQSHQILADPETGEVDPLKLFHMQAVNRLQTDQELLAHLRSDGIPWGKMNTIMKECIPDGITNDIDNLLTMK